MVDATWMTRSDGWDSSNADVSDIPTYCNSPISPERYNLVTGRGDDVQVALHVANGEMRHVFSVQRPLGTQDSEPPSSLAVVRDHFAGFKVSGWQWRIEHKGLGVERPHSQLVIIAGRNDAAAPWVPVRGRAALAVLVGGAQEALALGTLHVAGNPVSWDAASGVGWQTVGAIFRLGWFKRIGGSWVNFRQVSHIPDSNVLVVASSADQVRHER